MKNYIGLRITAFQMRGEFDYFVIMYGLFFETEQDILDYVSDPLYDQETDMPALCAAISYSKGDDGSLNFKFHYYDWEGYSY